MSTIRTSWLVPQCPIACSTRFCMWIYNQPPISLCLQVHASSTVGQLSQLAVRITCLWNQAKNERSQFLCHSPLCLLPSCTNHPFPITEQHVNLAAADKFRTQPACASLSLFNSLSLPLCCASLSTLLHTSKLACPPHLIPNACPSATQVCTRYWNINTNGCRATFADCVQARPAGDKADTSNKLVKVAKDSARSNLAKASPESTAKCSLIGKLWIFEFILDTFWTYV